MFSIVTSKVFGGLAAALAIALVFTIVTKNAVISHQEKAITVLEASNSRLSNDNDTLKTNTVTLESAITTCNGSIQEVHDRVESVAKAGTEAVAAVRKAGTTAVIAKIARIDALPSATCDDAMAILKAGGK